MFVAAVRLVVLVIALAHLTDVASCEETSNAGPDVTFEGTIEVQADHTFEADSRDQLLTDVQPSLELDTEFSLGEAVAIFSSISLEPVLDPGPGESRFFKDNGLSVNNVYVQLQHGNINVFAGKSDVEFGIAFDRAHGIYGSDLAEDYEIEKMITIGAEVQLEHPELGEHVVTGSVFFADTSILSDSLLTRSGRLKTSDGGLANTNSFSSFALNVKGEVPFAPGGIGYATGVSFQAGGEGVSNDELALAFALFGRGEIADDVRLDWVGEVAHLTNAEGGSGDRVFATISGKLGFGKFWIAPSLTHALDQNNGVADQQSVLATASVGVDVTEDLSVALGYGFMDERGEKSHFAGIKTEYSFGD